MRNNPGGTAAALVCTVISALGFSLGGRQTTDYYFSLDFSCRHVLAGDNDFFASTADDERNSLLGAADGENVCLLAFSGSNGDHEQVLCDHIFLSGGAQIILFEYGPMMGTRRTPAAHAAYIGNELIHHLRSHAYSNTSFASRRQDNRISWLAMLPNKACGKASIRSPCFYGVVKHVSRAASSTIRWLLI